ncbi:MAG: hypothetical protein IRY99_05405 [Isosphaeraceae bacterium]|nr:hypothetical protein [Isosphaeraceae bacterium]
MQTRRRFVLTLTAVLVALGLVVVPVLADELIGRITKVDVAASKIVVTEKGTNKEVDVKVTESTVYETPQGKEVRVNLEKLQKRVEKAKKGVSVIVTHEKGVASRIKDTTKKKEAAKP